MVLTAAPYREGTGVLPRRVPPPQTINENSAHRKSRNLYDILKDLQRDTCLLLGRWYRISHQQ